MKNFNVKVASNPEEVTDKDEFSKKIKNTNIPDNEFTDNLGIFMTRQNLSRILLINDLYKKIINVHGIVIEFGVRWGQNISLFTNLRGIYEPYNYNRKIVGFDTFKGFPSVSSHDGPTNKKGQYGVSNNWDIQLEEIVAYHEKNAPINHIKKHELIKGDATKTIKKYLNDNPQTIISLAYFDFDIYKPTKECLDAILPRVPKGGIVAFDELNCSDFPGETIAFNEVVGISNVKLRRDSNNPLVSYYINE